MESELEKLKKHMQESINFAIKNNEDLDDASWNYQEGILLSCNEAKLILDALKNLPNELKGVSNNEHVKKFCDTCMYDYVNDFDEPCLTCIDYNLYKAK